MCGLNNCLIERSELTTLTIGGGGGGLELYLDKKGGLSWKATNFRNAILITMDMFDLTDIQRKRYPNINKFSYTSKALNVKSIIDFFLISKELKKYVKTVDI